MEYKLIKEYPGSPKLGTIFNFVPCCTGKNCNKLKSTNIINFKIDPIKHSEFWKKHEVLFTTKDGVDIYHGDSYIYVHKCGVNSIKAYRNKEYYKNRDISFPINKRFSSREAYENYLKLTSPVLFTTEDMFGIRKNDYFYFVNFINTNSVSKTENIVKSSFPKHKYEPNVKKYFKKFINACSYSKYLKTLKVNSNEHRGIPIN